MAETIHPVSITEETRRRYLNYALSVITSRALPDVRDGLKPVQRRILFTMYADLHLHFDGRPRKCAKIAGDVTGNYHPHGNVPAYEALARMAQDFVMRMPLVKGQGNFGSVDGDPPAAERYTEAKITALSDHLMSELRQRTVEFRKMSEVYANSAVGAVAAAAAPEADRVEREGLSNAGRKAYRAESQQVRNQLHALLQYPEVIPEVQARMERLLTPFDAQLVE